MDEEDLEKKHSKTEREASPKVSKKELKLNKETEVNLCGSYRNGSRLSKKRQKKSA